MSGIIVAPFSNSNVRDWPLAHYTRLVGLLLERLADERRIRIIGAPGQKLRANEIVRQFPAARVVNECGRFRWTEILDEVRGADCVIGNNSGICHLGAHAGVPTVCVFGGSHQRAEWRPIGPQVIVVTRAIGCSPCQLDHSQISPYGKACLREIEPEVVADATFMIMERAARAAPDGRGRPGQAGSLDMQGAGYADA